MFADRIQGNPVSNPLQNCYLFELPCTYTLYTATYQLVLWFAFWSRDNFGRTAKSL